MAKYRLEVKNNAIKELSKIHPTIGMKLLNSIENLAVSPRPRQSHKLTGSMNCYRLRVGDYRILYQIDDKDELIIQSRPSARNISIIYNEITTEDTILRTIQHLPVVRRI